jgi:hypothetical protein
MDWRLEIARVEFGIKAFEDMPGIAAEALAEGMDSESLRKLAGLEGGDAFDIQKYLASTLQELGIMPPSRDEAAWILINYFLDEILASKIDTYDGLHTIFWKIYFEAWHAKDSKYVGDYGGLEKLYGLYDTYNELLHVAENPEDPCPWYPDKTNRQVIGELKQEIFAAIREFNAKRPDKENQII